MSVQRRSDAPYLHRSPLTTVIRVKSPQYPNQCSWKTTLSLCTDKEVSGWLPRLPQILMKNVQSIHHNGLLNSEDLAKSGKNICKLQ